VGVDIFDILDKEATLTLFLTTSTPFRPTIICVYSGIGDYSGIAHVKIWVNAHDSERLVAV
jgi:hypothetical protein